MRHLHHFYDRMNHCSSHFVQNGTFSKNLFISRIACKSLNSFFTCNTGISCTWMCMHAFINQIEGKNFFEHRSWVAFFFWYTLYSHRKEHFPFSTYGSMQGSKKYFAARGRWNKYLELRAVYAWRRKSQLRKKWEEIENKDVLSPTKRLKQT